MKLELKKRIKTSIILLLIVFLTIFINEIIFSFTVFVTSVICFYEWNNINIPYFVKRKKKGMLLIRLIGLIYIFIFFISSSIIYNKQGVFYLIFIILICVSSDVGGYIFGKTIGGKKLTKISPNKTISGSVGSFSFSIIPLILFSLLNENNLYLNFSLSISNILFCFAISLSCQMGDLVISYFKRLSKIKNTGNILPGHGGLLDRVDGMIFAIPFALFLNLTQIF